LRTNNPAADAALKPFIIFIGYFYR
jgi:hypothetical protein